MVILDVDSKGGYAAGHIPGAFLLADDDTALWAKRSNTFIAGSAQVPDRSQIDAIIRRANIDETSVVVLTGRDLSVVGRAYYTFRYWGFSREHLKVLNGSKNSYVAAGFPLETTEPKKPEPGIFSVCNLRPDLSIDQVRATFQEMLAIAEDTDSKTVIIDSRSSAEFSGKAAAASEPPLQKTIVAFEGHIKTAVNMEYRLLLEEGSALNPLRSREELIAAMGSAGIDKSAISFTYSGNGFNSSITFLALDAVLRWPVKIYDGGWLEWGQMASISNGGLLAENSSLRTDIDSRSESITYNKSQGFIKQESFNSSVPSAELNDMINRIDSTSCNSVGSGNKSLVPKAPGY
ncbi:MAG: rhodanese-like domain-containing protein [Desulfobulbaceae bacterium]|nr:rhodanese-like domain-containing protein [Desulfobulbaceae bacterium]